MREVHEETGLRAAVGRVLGVYSTVFERTEERPFDPLHFLSVVHEITVSGGDLVHEAVGTTDLAAWVPVSDLPTAPLVGLARYGWGLGAPVDSSSPGA